jgi:O-acetyl-ADP-ribose deacetylase (regulator of RNase III)
MEKKIHNSVLELCQGDITKQKVDAIVNAANSQLAGGGGVDGAIHRAGGPAIMEECGKIGGCPTGNAVITTGGNLFAKHVIHTVGPRYRNGKSGEPALLKNAYLNSLLIAEKHGIKTIAFPSISTGVYGYPIDSASKIALSTVIDYLKGDTGIIRAVFVLFSAQNYEIYLNSLAEL